MCGMCGMCIPAASCAYRSNASVSACRYCRRRQRRRDYFAGETDTSGPLDDGSSVGSGYHSGYTLDRSNAVGQPLRRSQPVRRGGAAGRTVQSQRASPGGGVEDDVVGPGYRGSRATTAAGLCAPSKCPRSCVRRRQDVRSAERRLARGVVPCSRSSRRVATVWSVVGSDVGSMSSWRHERRPAALSPSALTGLGRPVCGRRPGCGHA